MTKNNSKLQNRVEENKGFSLFEMVVVTIIGLTMLLAIVGMYNHYLDSHNRQERVLLVERTLSETGNALRQSVSVLPGQGLGTSNGEIFCIPTLPNAGTTTDITGKSVPIKLGIFTPYKVNGYDAFTIAYADPTIPRLSIKELTKIDLSNISIKIAVPGYIPPKLPPPPRGGGLTGTLGDITGNTIKSSGFSSSNDGQTTNIIIPPHTPTPTPTPSPVITPPPNPVPPNVDYNSTVLGQSWIPSTSMFHVGDAFLLVTSPAYDATDPTTTQTYSTLVQVTSVSSYTPTLAQGGSPYVQLGLTICSQGCGAFQGLTNGLGKFGLVGTNLVPLRLTSFYINETPIGKKLVRNDNGVILPTGNGTFQVQGGKESMVGQTDSLVVTYHLDDGTTQPTPNTPAVSWLNKIASVDIAISGSVPNAKGKEIISQQSTVNFPLNVRQLQ